LKLLQLLICFCVQEDSDVTKEIVEMNDGTCDMMIQVLLGLFGDPQCLYPNTDPSTYTQRATELLEAVLTSPRRHHQDGELFCITCLS